MLFFLFITIYLLSVFIHELTHYLMFRFQGVNVVVLKVFFLNITKGKFRLNINPIPFGYVIPSTQKISSVMKLSVLLKTIRDNLIITSLMQVLQLIICLVILIMIDTSSIIGYSILMFIIINTLMLLGSIDNSKGDLNLVRKYQKRDLRGFYAIICTSQILEGFHSELIYRLMKKKWKLSQSFHEFDMIVLNYIIEYEFRVRAIVSDELCSYLSNQVKTINSNFLYLYYKTLIYYLAANGRLYSRYDGFNLNLYKRNKEIINAINTLIRLIIHKERINAFDIVLYRNINESISSIKKRKEYLANTINDVIGGLNYEKED